MAATLKSFFGPRIVHRIAEMISGAWPAFPAAAFEADARRGLSRLELLARGEHIARALRAHLPQDVAEALAVLTRSLGPELSEDALDGAGLAPFLYLPHVAFVRTHGLAAFDAAMDAQHALTRRFSAEWSIRPFLEAEPERTLAVLRRWARDPSPHVRRLVSEGTRPRLPWAPRLRTFSADPRRTLALLELLRDDPSSYVRRSVANHLNDLGKDHPALLLDVARRWLRGAGPERRRLVAHALRSLARRGDREALALLGHGAPPRVALRAVSLAPARVPIGGAVRFEATLASRAEEPQALAVNLAVHYVKARGETRPKRFKLRPVALPPGGEVRVARAISLAQLSTRRHHPGVHRVELVLNGVAHDAGAFEVVTPPRGRGPAPAPRARGRAPPSRRPR
jgi:3-methyladenine DNA glycosylase AlkC